MVQSQDRDEGQLLRIGAVARQAEVSIDTVRYYERRGLLTPAGRLPSGYRQYTPAAVATITLARRLQSLGMTLDEVADALRAHDRPDSTCESERWRLEAVLDRTRARLAELTAVHDDLTAVLQRCSDGQCDLRAESAPRPR